MAIHLWPLSASPPSLLSTLALKSLASRLVEEKVETLVAEAVGTGARANPQA